ncbi:AAA family ATPase [Celeribacter sp. PS-C1]|uniref:AAA family ATPase n=1 Tax=Celeribacter sp. PS-C1 TaxID=2820813 RepID=UPI001C6625C1|nr:AAA family ATPase [Celeribacter sp. PS-C1]MBW6419510.1 AAA family ATPase [Celeribacter sp. PS-C1]
MQIQDNATPLGDSATVPFDPLIGFYGEGRGFSLTRKGEGEYAPITWRQLTHMMRSTSRAPAPSVAEIDAKVKNLLSVAKDAKEGSKAAEFATLSEDEQRAIACDECHADIKGRQPWVIYSDYREWDARTSAAQEDKGVALAVGIDADDVKVEAVKSALAQVLPGVRYALVTSYNHLRGAKGPRVRVVVPMTKGFHPRSYPYFAQAIYEEMAKHGVVCDATSGKVTQIQYFGQIHCEGTPEFYENDGAALDVLEFPHLMERTEALFWEDHANAGKTSERQQQGALYEFNRHVHTEQLLQMFHYELQSNDKWKYPNQSNAGTLVVHDDGGWDSLSGTMLDEVGGLKGAWTKDNRVGGDAATLFVKHALVDHCGMDPTAAFNTVVQIGHAMSLGYQLNMFDPVSQAKAFSPDDLTPPTGPCSPQSYRAWFTAHGAWLWQNLRVIGDQPAPAALDLSADTPSLFEFSFATGDEMTEQVFYHIDPWLPRNSVVAFYGRGETGKSTLVSTICASVSDKVSTLWVSSEENKNQIAVRYTKSGGHTNTLVPLSAAPKLNGTDKVAIFDCYEHLEKTICDVKAACHQSRPLGVVVLDAIGALVTWKKGENANDDGAVKRLIAHLSTLAERHEVTIVMIGHFNKRAQLEQYVSDAVTGSAAWTNSLRRAFACVKDETSEDGFSNFVLSVKGNQGSPLACAYKTIPVHTIHSRATVVSGSADEVLCKTEFTTEIQWGTKAVRDMVYEGEEHETTAKKKAKSKDQLSAMADAFKDAVLQIGRPCSRADVEGYIKQQRGLKIYPYHYSKGLDELIQERAVKIEALPHNKFQYSC